MQNSIILAFFLTTLAGLSTVLGAFLAFLVKTTCTKFLSFGLGLSAGVMIYLSFFELLKESNHLLTGDLNQNYSGLVMIMFLVGLGITGTIDMFTHSRLETNCGTQCKNGQLLLKTGMFTAVIIAVHNFPEGIATFTTANTDMVFGLAMTIAIAIHNIPEGFCIALPIYYATKSKKKGILYALYAGLAEPVGALLTYLFLLPYINDRILGIMLAIVAGIMVYISFDELLPTAKKYGGHVSLLGLVCGMFLIAFSLHLFH